MWIAYRFQHVPAAAMAVCQNAALNHLVPFTVGELFRSFTDLEEKIRSYKEQVFCELWKRDARTIAAARKRVGRPMKRGVEVLRAEVLLYSRGATVQGKRQRHQDYFVSYECANAHAT